MDKGVDDSPGEVKTLSLFSRHKFDFPGRIRSQRSLDDSPD